MQVRRKQKIDKVLGYFLIGLLWPLTRLLGLIMRRDHSMRVPPQKIVFIKLLGLGSLVLASDAVTMIKEKFPGTQLILLTDTNISAGIKPFGLYDEIWETNSNNLFKTFFRILYFLFKSWSWKNVCVVDLEVYSKLTTVLSLLTLARDRFGFILPSVSFRKYLNTHNILFDQSAVMEDNYIAMAAAITGSTGTQPFIRPEREQEHKNRYIIFNNTCSSLAYERKLPDPVLSKTCLWVLQNTTYELAFLGMQEDYNNIESFVESNAELSAMKNRILNYAGRSANFDAYYHFLKTEGVCLVTIDSGPLHLARKLGLPTLSLWGPTNPENYLKVHPEETERHLQYYLHTPCSPCIHRYEQLPCEGNNICMKEMDQVVIIEKIKQLLAYLSAPRSIVRKV